MWLVIVFTYNRMNTSRNLRPIKKMLDYKFQMGLRQALIDVLCEQTTFGNAQRWAGLEFL